MSTYTDLKNKLKETLNVDYKTRATNLKVIFVNEENLYYGSFEGELHGNITKLSGGIIEKTLIRDSALSNVVLYNPDGSTINLGNVATEILSLSSDIYGPDGFSDLVKKCKKDIEYVSSEVSSIASGYCDFKQEIIEKIDYLSSTISSEIDDRISADNVLYNRVHDEVLSAHKLRKEGDDALYTAILDTSVILSTAISALTEKLKSIVDHEKHFKVEAIDQHENPFKAKDFTVNELTDFIVADAIVSYKDKKVGKISKDSVILNRYYFDIFNELDTEMLSVLKPGDHIQFILGLRFDVKFGWSCYFNIENGKWVGTADPIDGNYWTVEIDGETAGTITDYQYTSESEPRRFKRGQLLILNPLYVTEHIFDIDDPESLQWKKLNAYGLTNRFTFLSDANYFLIEYNLRNKKFLELYNDLSNEKVFGKIWQENTSLDEQSNLISILVKLDSGKNIELTRDNCFYVDYTSPNNVLMNVSCDPANIANSTLDVTEKHFQYMYSMEENSAIKVVLSSNENTFLSAIPSNGKIYVDLTNAKLRPQFLNAYTLSCVGEYDWEYQEGDEATENSLRIDLNLIENTLHIVATYKDDSTIVEKSLKIRQIPSLFNPDTALVKICKSLPFDLTYMSDKTKELEASDYEKACRPGVSHTGEKSKKFDIAETSLSIILILLLDKLEYTDIARDFRFAFNAQSDVYDKIEILFLDEELKSIQFFDDRTKKIYIPTNSNYELELREVTDNKFLLIDFSEFSYEKQISTLHYLLSVETSARISSDLVLSSNDQHLSGLIDELWKNIRGGLCYKDTLDLCCKVLKENDTLSNLFANNFWNKRYVETYEELYNLKLREGWYYIAQAPKGEHLSIEGLEIENNDWIVINSNCLVSSVTSANVSILDAQDVDTFRLSSNNVISGHNIYHGLQEFFEVSAKNAIVENLTISGLVSVDNIGVLSISALSGLVSTLTAYEVLIRDGISARSDDIFIADRSSYLSNIFESHELSVLNLSIRLSSAEISVDNLCNEISSRFEFLSNAISDNYDSISSISAALYTAPNKLGNPGLSGKVDFLLSVGMKAAEYYGTLLSVDVHKDKHLSCFLHQALGYYDYKNIFIKTGNIYRLSSVLEDIIDKNGNVVSLFPNDYIIFNQEGVISDAIIDSFDVIRDSYTECLKISSDLSNLDNYVKLSLELSVSLISSRINTLCTEISSDISSKYLYLSSEISSNDNDISYISDYVKLSLELSVSQISSKINTLCTEISNDITAKFEFLSGLISSNDNDIRYLSSELSDYHNTLSGIDRNEYKEVVNVATDNLMITDMDWIHDNSNEKGHFDKYYMTMKYGTLVLKKI